MPDSGELLVDDASDRTRRVAVAGVVLLLGLAAGGAALRSTLPPEPLDVALASVSGTALQGESFVRLQLKLRSSGAQALGGAALTVAGTTQSGSHPPAFDGDGRLTVQVDVTPACEAVAAGVGTGQLDLEVRDDAGELRALRLDVPSAGRLERLLRYRCRTADPGSVGTLLG